MRPRVRNLTGRFLITILALNSLGGLGHFQTTTRAQNKVIIVNAEQPNVWTLEQAHYLLAQMHRRNLDLKAKSLDDLDPNEITGLRFELMKMLVEFGATFNQADLVSNRMLTRNQEFNTERREELLTQRDRLRRESLRLTGEISDLEVEKADAEEEDDKKRVEAKLNARKARRDKVDKEIELTDEELKTLNAPSGQLKATEGGAEFKPNSLPQPVLEEAFTEAAKKQIEQFNSAPKINASLRLENFLQMQYEIIAKQLTLLRDEVGPGERLLFLELPQTVNVAHHEANDKWAQSWWKIAGYVVRCPKGSDVRPAAVPHQCKDDQSQRTAASPSNAESAQAAQLSTIPNRDQISQPKETRDWETNERPITTTQETTSLLRRNNRVMEVQGRTKSQSFTSQFVNLDKIDPEEVNEDLMAYMNSKENRSEKDGLPNVVLTDRQVRTVELIPRQSSLNVNDMKLHARAGAFNFVLSTLFGFGSRLNIQRQREQASQFVQQELYSAAFGKGAREFGWTFTPMPGMERLMSGVRTTYAVVVVPEEATSLVLESNGCYFPRSAYQPNDFADTKNPERWGSRRTSRGCGDKSRAFVMPIPSGNMNGSNDFWVEGISYQPVSRGERAVVLISGKNFSGQIGVLVNGVSLIHAIGLAQPLIRDDSKAGIQTVEDFKNEKVNGRIERVDSNKIIFSFKMPDDYTGTPTITLIAPGRAVDINWLPHVNVNEIFDTSLINYTSLRGSMFKPSPSKEAFRIDSAEAFRRPDRKLAVLITGAGFVAGQRIYVNGVQVPGNPVVGDTLINVASIDAPSDEKILVAVSSGDKTVKATAINNPAYLKIDKVTIVSLEPAKEKQPAVMVVRLEGSGFPATLEPSNPAKVKVDVTSPIEVYLTITDPAEAEVVTLTDPDTRVSVKALIPRRAPAK